MGIGKTLATIAADIGIAADMVGQDNQCTRDPIFVVQQLRRIYGLDLDYAENVAWMYDGEEVALSEEALTTWLHEHETTLEREERDGLTKTGFVDVWEFVQPFFSRKGADAYIKANRHRLTAPRVYVDSAYRNPEWIAVRQSLIALGRMIEED